MSAIEFTRPEGFWLAAVAAGVVLAHLLRRRAKRREVPFLPLWSAVVASQHGGFGRALVRRLDLALVLLACGAVGAAAAGARLPGKPSTLRDLVLVLDGGVSLRAGDRALRMRRIASAEIRRRAPGTRFVVISVGDAGCTVWSGAERAKALAATRAHRPGWTEPSSEEALRLARAAAGTLRDPDLVFCTHRRVPEAAGFRLRTAPVAVSNAGFESLEVLADAEGGGALIRVGLRGHGRVRIEGHWSGEVDGHRVVSIPLDTTGRVALRVRSGDDGFPPDDVAYLVLPERRAPRVLVIAKRDPSAFLVAALQALEATGDLRGPLDRTTPDHAGEQAARTAYDVLVFDRCTPREPLQGVRALFLAPMVATGCPFRIGEPGPAPALFDVQRDHPLLRGLEGFERIVPVRARAVLGGRALAFSAPGPVLAAAPGWIALGFDPEGCILAASPAYPLLLRNAIRILAATAVAQEREFLAIGESAPGTGVADVEGRGPVRVGRRLLGPPGFWTLGDRTFGVNLLLPGLDLAPPATVTGALPPVGEPGESDRPLAPWLAAAALGFLLVAWWAYWRD